VHILSLVVLEAGFPEQIRHADHTAQRCPQLVVQARQELTFQLVEAIDGPATGPNLDRWGAFGMNRREADLERHASVQIGGRPVVV
jgi:hypothetical protein